MSSTSNETQCKRVRYSRPIRTIPGHNPFPVLFTVVYDEDAKRRERNIEINRRLRGEYIICDCPRCSTRGYTDNEI